MPVTYQINRETAFIETHCTGEVTLDEVLDHFRQLEAEPSLPRRLDVLLDLDKTTSLPESPQLMEVTRAVERLRAKVEWGVCAIVANRDALYGMSRIFEVFAEKQFDRISVFRDREDAKRWMTSNRSSTA
jgi:hypothetical protein